MSKRQAAGTKAKATGKKTGELPAATDGVHPLAAIDKETPVGRGFEGRRGKKLRPLTYRGAKGKWLVFTGPEGLEERIDPVCWAKEYISRVADVYDPGAAAAEATPAADGPAEPVRSAATPKADLVMVRVGDIDATHNVRMAPDEGFLAGLQASMADVGLLQPVVVRKRGKALRMVAGHQRLEAARRAGEEFIEAKVYSGVDDGWEARARLAENVQRIDLNHIELAAVYAGAADAGMTVRAMAEEGHVSADSVRRHLALRRLCEPVARLVASGRLPVHQGELIARVGDVSGQIGLTASATRLDWDDKAGKWAARGKYDYRRGKQLPALAEQTVHDRDYVQPMDQLRKDVAAAMQSMGACGWPMDADYAGKRPCHGCPDNTLTYADEPMLFAGLEPKGSARKGHCTNGECYRLKRAAWDQVLPVRKAKRETARRKAIVKARKAGLDVCDECIDKVAKRSARSSGESWDARSKRIAALKRKFPWDQPQRLALAVHDYGRTLAETIGKAIASGKVGADGDCHNVAELILWAQSASHWRVEVPDKKYRPAIKTVLGEGISDADLAVWWTAAARWAQEEEKPGINYNGKVVNVPLDRTHAAKIDALEKIAKALGVEIPPRPTRADMARAEQVALIVKSPKAAALALIAACKDLTVLEAVAAGKPAKYKAAAVAERIAQLKKAGGKRKAAE